MDMIKFFITWGPTFLFLIVILFGILVGFIRGFRKSLILFIHMLVVGLICLIIYLCLINNPNLDSIMVNFINGIIGKFGNSLQNIVGASESCTTLHEMLLEVLLKDMDDKAWMIQENAAYINTLVDLGYHLILAILCYILYFIILFVLYIIYLIAYPVRRKIKKENRKFQQGEINHPYKKRRLLGGLIGCIRSTMTAVICFSFLGSLIFIVTGGTNLPSRDQIKDEETVEFKEPLWNEVYDYYSYVCEMGNTGIFQVLNSMKDTKNTPFYFYFADLVLQGKINDENLGVENEKFYLRDELGEYVHFINSTFALVLKYGEVKDIESLVSGENSEQSMDVLIRTLGNPGFADEFSSLIDEFEGKPFMANLCLSALTSLVNHIDTVTEDEMIVGLVNQLFKSEDSIKVTDLATEDDVKSLFKGLIQAVVEVNDDPVIVMSLSDEDSVEEANKVSTKKVIKIAKNLLPTIQGLSLFTTREEVGNKIIQGLYTYASLNLVEEEFNFEVPSDINWINEFNILFNACDPLLSIAYEIYDDNQDVLIDNLLHLFDKENGEEMEEYFDDLSDNLVQSNLLDVVFKSSLVGKFIDQIVYDITKDETTKIPKNIDYVGKKGECSILLTSVKLLLKNGGGSLIMNLMNNGDNLTTEEITEIILILTKDVTVNNETTQLIKCIIQSKLIHYILSTLLLYTDFGSFKLYIPEGDYEIIEDCKIIKLSEFELIADLLSNCIDLIVEVIDNPNDLNYAHIFSNNYIKNTIDDSILLQGTLANVIIELSKTTEEIILPKSLASPENWLNQKNENKKGEISTLLNVISKVSEIKVDDEKYLINELLNGTIDPSALLNLDKKVLDDLCSSKVLQYTISDSVTSLGSNDFKLVVARASLETVNAETTTEKTVNVIKSSELSEIFSSIQKIITFDESKEVKVKYNAIFENKAELSKSTTITATLIQLLFDYEDSGFIVVPKKYKQDFEKFKTDLDLTGNAWLGPTDNSTDDELYLMLAALETFIEKDADGNIPEEFNFETLQDDLKLRESGIDDICASAVLNASISKRIITTFHVPTESYQNEVIVQKDLDALFKAVFLLFNKKEIVVKELDDDLFNLQFNRSDTSIVLDSVILRATISSKMARLNEISVPKSIVRDETFVDKEDGYIVSLEELTYLFDAMFSIFNSDTIMVNNLEQHLTELEISKDSIDYITNSRILNATVSSKLTDNNQVVILKKDIIEETLINNQSLNNIKKNELNKLLQSIFILLNKDKIVVSDISTQVNNLRIAKKDIDTIIDSEIITATISVKLSEMNELTIPLSVVNDESTTQNTIEHIIQKTELKSLFNALYTILKEDTIEVNNINAEFQDLSLASQDIDTIIDSDIITATISVKLSEMNELTIPLSVVNDESTTQNTIEHIIQKTELKSLFNALYTILKEDTIEVNNINAEFQDLSLASQDIDTLFESIILCAVVSEKLTTNDELIIPVQSVDTIETITDSSFYMIQLLELKSLFHAMFVLFDADTLSLNSFNTDLQAFNVEPEKLEDLLDSFILHTTISKKVIANDELIIPVQCTEKINTLTISNFYLIEYNELMAMFDAMFALFDSNQLALNYINVGLQDFDIDAQKVTVLLKSVIIQATISKNFVDVESLDIPEIVQEQYETITAESRTKIAKDELQAFFNAIFATTNGSISGTDFTLGKMNLPVEYTSASTMTQSLIIAATLSNNIMKEDSIVCVVDELKVHYIFHQQSSSKMYIVQDELANLLIALTVGMGATDPTNLSFTDVAVPQTDAQKTALVGSEIIRTTISQKVLNQDNTSIAVDSVQLDTTRHYREDSVGILSATEILNIVKGLELLNPTNGSFDNLILNVGDIILMPNKEIVLRTIAESEIYRCIISHTLGENKGTSSTPIYAYQLFVSNTPTVYIDDVEYQYMASMIPGRYYIQYPSTFTEVWTSFILGTASQDKICEKLDIIALQYTLQQPV